MRTLPRIRGDDGTDFDSFENENVVAKEPHVAAKLHKTLVVTVEAQLGQPRK